MNIEHWLYLATVEIRFPPDREAVRQELLGHLEDKKEAYLRQGRTLYEAETTAAEDMGDPKELAKELGRIHRPWWGYFWRFSRVVLILAALWTLWGAWANRGGFALIARPELPEEGTTSVTKYESEDFVCDTTIFVPKTWRPMGEKDLGGYRFTSPVAWLEQWGTDYVNENSEEGHGAGWNLMICLRADTWRFWEVCSSHPYMILKNVVADSQGVEYAREEVRQGCRDLFCETWQEPFTTWYLVELYLPGPEHVPEWVDIPVGYGGSTIRVDLAKEAVS